MTYCYQRNICRPQPRQSEGYPGVGDAEKSVGAWPDRDGTTKLLG